jgi:hypothetical protein
MAVRLSALRSSRALPPPPGRILVLISVFSRAIVRLEGFGKLKYLMTSSGFEPMTSRLVALFFVQVQRKQSRHVRCESALRQSAYQWREHGLITRCARRVAGIIPWELLQWKGTVGGSGHLFHDFPQVCVGFCYSNRTKTKTNVLFSRLSYEPVQTKNWGCLCIMIERVLRQGMGFECTHWNRDYEILQSISIQHCH